MSFDTCVSSCNHYHNQYIEQFHYPPKMSSCFPSIVIPSPYLSFLATTDLFSITIISSFLRMSNKWACTICRPLRLLLSCSMSLQFIQVVPCISSLSFFSFLLLSDSPLYKCATLYQFT